MGFQRKSITSLPFFWAVGVVYQVLPHTASGCIMEAVQRGRNSVQPEGSQWSGDAQQTQFVLSSVFFEISVYRLNITNVLGSQTPLVPHLVSIASITIQMLTTCKHIFLALSSSSASRPAVCQTSCGYFRFNMLKMELIASSISVICLLHFIVIIYLSFIITEGRDLVCLIYFLPIVVIQARDNCLLKLAK